MKISNTLALLATVTTVSATAAHQQEEKNQLRGSTTVESAHRGLEYDPTMAKQPSASYTFSCGEYGGGFVDIVTGKMNFGCELTGMGALTQEPAVGYHLHTIWDLEEEGSEEPPYSTDKCGGDYTGLHYDPTNKCGPASELTFLDAPKCANTNYRCSPESPQLCERGDLSGKYGSIELVNGVGSKVFMGDNFQAMPQDFVEDNAARDPKLFSSIVFHEPSGKRVLCCKLSPTDAAEAAKPSKPIVIPAYPDDKPNNGKPKEETPVFKEAHPVSKEEKPKHESKPNNGSHNGNGKKNGHNKL